MKKHSVNKKIKKAHKMAMPCKKAIDIAVEAICNKGCKQVHMDISRIKKQQQIPKELDLLHVSEQKMVLLELEKIMSIYGDRCQL